MNTVLFYTLAALEYRCSGGRFRLLKYRVMPEELAVAAVAVFPILLVGRRGGTGAPLRAAVFVLPLLQLGRGVTQSTVCHFMPFTRLVSTNKRRK